MVSKQKILIVDDDNNIAELISLYLTKECFDTMIVNDGESVMPAMETFAPNLILLDLMLPGIDGYQVCREVRAQYSVPIIMLSAKGEVFDKVLGLELGADDYMTKPFSPNELVARVKAHISRYDTLTSKSGDVITVGKLMIDKDAHKVTVDGKEISLTAKEYDLLLFLAENPNHTFSKEVLFDRIWGMDAIGDVSTVTVHIQRVRDKINTENERYIETIWGVGYRFNI